MSARVTVWHVLVETIFWLGVKSVFYHGHRGRSVWHSLLLTKWRSSVVAGSDIHQAVHPFRVDGTSSSIPERISSSECGKSSRLGAIPCWTNRSDGAGTSSGSMTSGMPAVSPFDCFSYLLNTQEPFDAFASRYGCQDDCGVEGRPGGISGAVTRFIPSVVHRFFCATGDVVGVHGLRSTIPSGPKDS